MNSINNKRKNRNTNSISNPGGGGGGHGVPINKYAKIHMFFH